MLFHGKYIPLFVLNPKPPVLGWANQAKVYWFLAIVVSGSTGVPGSLVVFWVIDGLVPEEP